MIFFLKRLLNRSEQESVLVRNFHKRPQETVDALTAHFLTLKTPFKFYAGMYYSECGHVCVDNDIYGYEVQILPNEHWLDCNPDAYGLKKSQAMALYDAILSNVPGSIYFRKKHKLEETA